MSGILFRSITIFLALFLGYLPIAVSGSADASTREPAPDFSLPLATGTGEINLKDLKGQVVYLDFWATWCPPCRKSFPWMNELNERYKKAGLTIIAVGVDKKLDLIKKFIGETNPGFAVAHDPTGTIAKTYKLRAMPSSYLIDREGRLVSTHLGFRTSKIKQLETEIQHLLEE